MVFVCVLLAFNKYLPPNKFLEIWQRPVGVSTACFQSDVPYLQHIFLLAEELKQSSSITGDVEIMSRDFCFGAIAILRLFLLLLKNNTYSFKCIN